MQKILHISKYYYPFRGGIEQTARDCVNALDGVMEQKVICFNHNKGAEQDQIDNVDIIRCACQCKLFSQSISVEFGKKLREVIESFSPDYILIHYPNPFVTHLLLKYIPDHVKLIVYWHLDITKQKLMGKLFHSQNIRLLKRADKIIATSPNYITGSPFLSKAKDKCVVIPSCINEERLSVNDDVRSLAKKIKSDNKDKIICMAVGRHVEYKGFEYLINASKILDDRFAIYFVGKGKLTQKLKDLANGDAKVHFLGSLSDQELKAYYLASDIFCFPSITKNEAFGLALAEGMYFGMPAVTYNIKGSGVNYVSLDQVTGIEVENRSVEKYAAALQKLADNASLRESLGKAGQERVLNNFLYKQFKENIRNLFEL